MNVEKLKRKLYDLDEMSVTKFAESIGVNRSTVYRWFSDPGSIPLAMLQKIIEVLGLTLEEAVDIFLPDTFSKENET